MLIYIYILYTENTVIIHCFTLCILYSIYVAVVWQYDGVIGAWLFCGRDIRYGYELNINETNGFLFKY